MRSVLSTVSDWVKTYESWAVWLEGVALVAILIYDIIDGHQQHKQTLAQMTIMQNQALATETAANAANKSIDIILDKERARVRIKPENLDFTPIMIVAHYSVFNYAPTFAFIERAQAEVRISNEKTLPRAEPFMFMPMGLPEAIHTNIEGIEGKAYFLDTQENMGKTFESIRAEKSFVHFRGAIEYKDVFGKEHITEFAYVWTLSSFSPPPGQQRGGFWLKNETKET
jgi:hypothetical protein